MRKRDEVNEGCFAKAAEDEPLFVLRAQDELAPTIVELWAYKARSVSVPENKVQQAFTLAQMMRDWQKIHGSKIPD